ncbi:choice-of-anchor D domain-containing protein, partial [Flavobacteriaceae bacterium]|nr:choice-of-anchor D domain-containing protein [Flavobacteriaceae bacterium]
MKKIILLLVLVISFSTIAQNTFSISSESVEVGDNFTLDIDLANSIEVTAFQFDLSHNENAYELTLGSALSTRAENHTLSVSTVDENTIRVLVYSTSNDVISAGNGTVLSLTFSSENEPNTYNLSISNIVLSDQNGESVSVDSTNGSVTLLGSRYDLTTSAVDFGEIPVDSSPSQSVTVSNSGNEDLVILSYAIDAPFSIAQTLPVTITPGNSSSFTIEVDTSTKQVVESVLSFSTNDQDPLRAIQSTTIQADIFAVNEIYIGSGQGVSNSEITIPVTISNMEPFSAFQFDVTLPNDVIYSENSTVFSSRSQDHVITASIINTNTIRFVSYSGTNTNFIGNDGEVFSFKIIPNITSGTYNLPITDAIISNENLVDITSDIYNGSFTINAPFLSTSVQVVDYGNIPITEVQTTSITLSNSGSATLIIDELVFDSSNLLFPLEIPTTLEVNESTTVTLEFTPSQTGSFNEDISIRNNSPEEQQIINVLANVFSPNYLSISDTNVFKGNSYEIPLNLVNNENIRAIQFDLNIPEGFIFDLDNVVETSILNNFTTSVFSLGNNNYRFLIYTVSNDFMNSGDETILKLPILVENTIDLGQYTFEISNVVLSSESNNQN